MRPAAAHLLLLAFLGVLLQVRQVTCGLPTRSSRPLRPPALSTSPLRGRHGGGAAAEEEKVRLGSSPPSCRGRCYECSPCSAVQVPTLSVGPSGPSAAARARRADRAAATTLSNYKPVGWKCQCRDRLYEP